MTVLSNNAETVPGGLNGTAVSPAASPTSYWTPVHIVESAWLEHGPFAFWIVDATRPATLVELGTHNGYSFFAFCEAARRLQTETSLFAVDTWVGDDHAGFYTDEVYELVESVRSATYSGSATLLRGYFDDHVSGFENGTIDLLHIDGRHGYDDVKHDFESWLPKMSERGVVLFHDIAERERGFGVWQFWEELVATYPSFSFEHGHGLGVIATGHQIPEALRPLLEAPINEVTKIRAFYRALGADISAAFLHGREDDAIREQLDVTSRALAETQAELASVLGSFSWRAAGPLRTVTGFLPQRLRNRLKAAL